MLLFNFLQILKDKSVKKVQVYLNDYIISLSQLKFIDLHLFNLEGNLLKFLQILFRYFCYWNSIITMF